MAMVTGIYSHNGIPFSSWILLCFLSKTSSHSEFELFLNHYGQQQCTGIFISDVTNIIVRYIRDKKTLFKVQDSFCSLIKSGVIEN